MKTSCRRWKWRSVLLSKQCIVDFRKVDHLAEERDPVPPPSPYRNGKENSCWGRGGQQLPICWPNTHEPLTLKIRFGQCCLLKPAASSPGPLESPLTKSLELEMQRIEPGTFCTLSRCSVTEPRPLQSLRSVAQMRELQRFVLSLLVRRHLCILCVVFQMKQEGRKLVYFKKKKARGDHLRPLILPLCGHV